MTLVEFVPPTPHPLWKLCPQMGITDVVVKVNPDLTGLADPWRYETLSSIVGRLKSAGLNVVGLEGDPFDMSPIKEYGAGVGENSSSWREAALAHYRELLESMDRLGIRLLCYNFMVGKGWSRTGVREGRGGAKATYFSLKDFGHKEHKEVGEKSSSWREENSLLQLQLVSPTETSNSNSTLQLNENQVWANYEYFIKAVMPTAEKCGVRMSLHPDDPCLPSLGGYARIFGSVEAYDRAYSIYPSPSNAVTFCQANFKLMPGNGGVGDKSWSWRKVDENPALQLNTPTPTKTRPVRTLEDAARHFGKRIAFIHVRDVEGTKEDFTELFHDQGDTDQFALMRTYREIGLDVPLRGDHVPEMAYDRDLTPEGTPGYFTLGRLFANGYLKALLEGTENAKSPISGDSTDEFRFKVGSR